MNLSKLEIEQRNETLRTYYAQEKWRQKQIKKYYYDGRPLFGTYKSNFRF